MKAINIKWDTDDQVVDLPTEVEIPEGYSEDEVADYLSDEYGYCVFNFDIDGDEKMKNLQMLLLGLKSKDVETNEIVWGSDEEE